MPVPASQFDLAPETPLENYTHLLVYLHFGLEWPGVLKHVCVCVSWDTIFVGIYWDVIGMCIYIYGLYANIHIL